MHSEREHEILNRILKAVETDYHSRFVEIVCAVFLSLATLLSAWCVYQSSQWNGEQFFRIEDYNGADRKRLQFEIEASQRHAAEALLFTKYIQTLTDGNAAFAEIIKDRFPDHLKKAVQAWEETDPLNNPSAPRVPFEMKEYITPEAAPMAEASRSANQYRQAANEADQTADRYMLLSIFLSMVLFFSGLAGVVDDYLNQRIFLGLSLMLLIATVISLFRMPVVW